MIDISQVLSINLFELYNFIEFIISTKEESTIYDLEKIECLRKELETLYLAEGLTDRVLKLSQKLDKELCKIQKNILKE